MISRALAAPEKSLMACPPLTYAVIGVAILAFVLSGFNGLAVAFPFVFLQPIAIALTFRDPDCAFIWIAWGVLAKTRIASRSVVLAR